MDEDHKSDEPTVWSADGWASATPAAPGPSDSTAAPVGTGAGSPGRMPGPPPAPPGAPGGPSGWAQWAGAPGPVWAASPRSQAHRHRAPTIILAVVLLVIGMAAGFGIGHVSVRLGQLPVRLGHVSVRLGHLPVRLGLAGLQFDRIRRPLERIGDRRAGRPWPCGCEHHPQLPE